MGWTGDSPGRCFNLSVLPVSHAAIGVALDVWMIILPALEVLALKLKPRDAIAVILMFGCGVLLTVISCLRIPYLLTYSRSANLTIDSLQTGVWTYSEIAVGIIVACMPNVRQLVAQLLLPRIRSTPSLRRRTRPGPRFALLTRTVLGGGGGSGTAKRESQAAILCRESTISVANSENLKSDGGAGGAERGGGQCPLTDAGFVHKGLRAAEEERQPTPPASGDDAFAGRNANSDIELSAVRKDPASGRQKAAWQTWD
ncbi:hypothetical protein RB594_007212 [Gaeumannomyces avenae]